MSEPMVSRVRARDHNGDDEPTPGRRRLSHSDDVVTRGVRQETPVAPSVTDGGASTRDLAPPRVLGLELAATTPAKSGPASMPDTTRQVSPTTVRPTPASLGATPATRAHSTPASSVAPASSAAPPPPPAAPPPTPYLTAIRRMVLRPTKSGDENAAAGEMDFTTTAIVAGILLVLIIMASMTAVTLLGFFFAFQCRIIAKCKFPDNVVVIVVVGLMGLNLYCAYSINELGNKSVDAAAGVFSTAHSMFFGHRKSPTNTPLHNQDTCNARDDSVTTLPGLFYLNADQITILRKHFCG